MSESKSLPQLIFESHQMIGQLIESGGEIDEQMETMMTEVQNQLAEKVDNYALFLDRLKAEVAFYKEREKELQKVRKGLEKLDEALKTNIKLGLQKLQKRELEGENYRFKMSDSQPRLIIDESQLPDDFKIEVVSYQVDKDKVRDALDADLNVPGAKLEEGKTLRKYVNSSAKKKGKK